MKLKEYLEEGYSVKNEQGQSFKILEKIEFTTDGGKTWKDGQINAFKDKGKYCSIVYGKPEIVILKPVKDIRKV